MELVLLNKNSCFFGHHQHYIQNKYRKSQNVHMSHKNSHTTTTFNHHKLKSKQHIICASNDSQIQEKYEQFRKIKKRSGFVLDTESMSDFKSFLDEFREDIMPLENMLNDKMQLKKGGLTIEYFIADILDNTELICKELSAILDDFISNNQYIDIYELFDILKMKLSNKVNSFIGNLATIINGLAVIFVTLFFAWIASLFGSNIWERWQWPSSTFQPYLPWPSVLRLFLTWTIPHALITFIIWRKEFRNLKKSIKAFEIAEANLTLNEEFILKKFSMLNPFSLIFKALTESFAKVIIQQGIILGIIAATIQGILSSSLDANGYENAVLGTFNGPIIIPSLLKVPIEIGILSVFCGLGSIFQDKSFFGENEAITEAIGEDPRISTTSLEEFKLLSDNDVTNERAWITFAYYFINAAYLSTEAIMTNSLIMSFGTLSIGRFIMYKSINNIKDI